jgi:tetratricopeptide (TPR) repeat protein
MKLTDQDIALITKYIDKRISDSELILFKDKMADQEFAAEVALQLGLLESLNETEKTKLREEYKQLLSKTLESNPAPKISFLNSKLRWAIILLLIVVAILTFRSWFGLSAEERLFAEFYSPLPPIEVQRSSENANQVFIKALKTYQDENYAAALPQFRALIDKDPMFSSYQLYAGISALALKQTDQAATLLTQVWVTGDDILRQHAEWYYTLTLLRKGNVEEAKDQANRMAEDSQHLYRKMAALLAKELI